MDATTFRPRVRIVSNGSQFRVENSFLDDNGMECWQYHGGPYYSIAEARESSERCIETFRASMWHVCEVAQV